LILRARVPTVFISLSLCEPRWRTASPRDADLLPPLPSVPSRSNAHEQIRRAYSLILPVSIANLSSRPLQTFHTHHAGRARYTLVRPPPTLGEAPIIKHVVMGSDTAAGEVRQLFVEGGWWKASEIPDEDLRNGQGDEDRTGCLISDVVVPGE
jgi:hypothetical protein